MSDELFRSVPLRGTQPPGQGGGAPAEDGGDGSFDPRKVYETLAAILNRRPGVEVRLVGVTYTPPGDGR